MDFRHKREHLSFSIENILQDDFSHRVGDNNGKISPLRSTFAKRLASAPYQLYGIHYFRPMIVSYLPVVHRVDARFLRVDEENEQKIVDQNPANNDNFSGYEDESTLENNEDAKTDEKGDEKPMLLEMDNSEDLTPKRRQKHRSHFTQHQVQHLDKLFSRQKYLTRDERTLLARRLEMTELQIRNWFQNRRYLERKRTNECTNQVKANEPWK